MTATAGVTVHVSATATAAARLVASIVHRARSGAPWPARRFPRRYATATAASATPVAVVDMPNCSVMSAPLNTSVPAQAAFAQSSPMAQRCASARRRRPRRDVSARWIGESCGRPRTASPASSAAGSGSARNASRQWTSATTPISGMPTIHAVGGPAKACATTRVRRSGSLHAAVAATPAVRIIAIPIHIGICASASSANEGAAALASEPTASSALATPSSARGEYRVSSRPATSAATTASGAARIRNCPATATETPKSSATSLRIGERTSTPAWLATNARKSTSEGDAKAPRSPPEDAGGE